MKRATSNNLEQPTKPVQNRKIGPVVGTWIVATLFLACQPVDKSLKAIDRPQLIQELFHDGLPAEIGKLTPTRSPIVALENLARVESIVMLSYPARPVV